MCIEMEVTWGKRGHWELVIGVDGGHTLSVKTPF